MELFSLLYGRVYGFKTKLKSKVTYERLKQLNLSNICTFQNYHSSRINCIDIDINDGKFLLSCAESGEIGIFNITNFNARFNGANQKYNYSKFVIPLVTKVYEKYGINTIQWYPVDTGIFTSSSFSEGLHVWDTNKLIKVEKFSFEYPIHHHHMSTVSSSPLMAVASNNVYLIDLLVGSHVQTLPLNHSTCSKLVRWSNTNQYILINIQNDILYIWDVRQIKNEMCMFNLKNPINGPDFMTIQGLEFCPDTTSLAVYFSNGTINVYDTLHLTKDPTILNPYQRPLISFPQVPFTGREWVTRFSFGRDLLATPCENRIKIVETKPGIGAGSYLVPALHFGDITNCIPHPKTAGCLYTSSLDASIIEWSVYNQFEDNLF